MDDKRLLDKTGKTGDEWIAYLEKQSGKKINDIDHKSMAELIVEDGISEWWAQGVAVSVEQRIGRRVVGQTCRGTFSASASKTVTGEWTSTFEEFCAFMSENLDRLPSPPDGDVRISETEKWRYWKIDLIDGAKISVNCQAKSSKNPDAPAKTGFGVSHDNLGSLEEREECKVVWKEILADFASTLQH